MLSRCSSNGHTYNRQARAPGALKQIIEHVEQSTLTGNPGADWLSVRRIFKDSGVAELKLVADQVLYLMGFNRGRQIADSLAEVWLRTGTYRNARQIIERVISEDQISGSDGRLTGINVMTMHKSKGKEFDGVVILHLGRISPICPDWEVVPHIKSRKLLRVGVTRARHEVLILTDVYSASPLLIGHNLY